MKRILIFILSMSMLFVSMDASPQSAFQGALGALDTLTNADTSTYTVTVSGSKSSVTFQVNVLKISGTIAGFVKLYGSADGTNYTSKAIDSVALENVSWNYTIPRDYNPYAKYQLKVITTGTSSVSNRAWMMWRRQP